MFTKKKTDELQALLEPIHKRLIVRQLVRQMIVHGLAGVAGGVAFLIVARFFPVPFYRWIGLAFLVLGLLSGMILMYWRKPTLTQCAHEADGNGLAQRVVTAWENRENPSRIAMAQREDALRHLRKQLPHIRESIHIWQPVRTQAMAFGLLLAVGGLLVIGPNPQDVRLAQMAAEEKALEEANSQIEAIKQETKNSHDISDAQKKQLEEMLEQAKKALAQAKDPAERLNALRAAQKQVEKWKETEQQKQAALARLQQNLANNSGTESLANALKSEDRKLMTEALRQSAKAMEAMSEKERETLAKELEKAAEQLRQGASETQSEELKQAANQLAMAAQQIAQGQVAQAMTAMEGSLVQAMSGASSAEQAMLAAAQASLSLQQSQMALASAAGGQPSTTAGAGQAVPASGTPAGNSSGQPSGTAAANNPGPGAINQPGNGSGGAGQGNGNSGSGKGAGGNGAGTGNGNGNGSGSGGGQGSGSGAGLGAGKHELVTVPSARIGGDGPSDTAGGPLGAGPSQTRQSGNSPLTSGGTLPYEEVYGQYEQFARESMEKGVIPGDYQQVVKDYFSKIEP